jgi:hypothetical protein
VIARKIYQEKSTAQGETDDESPLTASAPEVR